MGDMVREERERAEARALIAPHLERLHGEYMALRRDHSHLPLVVEVPAEWPKQFDVGSTLFGMPIVRADVDEPRVMSR